MRHIRITVCSNTQKKLKEKQASAEKLGDLRLYKKITAILAVSESLLLSEAADFSS
jgi:hypothetical protein